MTTNSTTSRRTWPTLRCGGWRWSITTKTWWGVFYSSALPSPKRGGAAGGDFGGSPRPGGRTPGGREGWGPRHGHARHVSTLQAVTASLERPPRCAAVDTFRGGCVKPRLPSGVRFPGKPEDAIGRPHFGQTKPAGRAKRSQQEETS